MRSSGNSAVDYSEPFLMPIVMDVLVWITLGLRQPHIFRLTAG